MVAVLWARWRSHAVADATRHDGTGPSGPSAGYPLTRAPAHERDGSKVRARLHERPHRRVDWAIVRQGQDAEHDVRPIARDGQGQMAPESGAPRPGR
jgi:hypothetical protein